MIDRVGAVLPISTSSVRPGDRGGVLSRRATLVGALAVGTAACTPYSLGGDQQGSRTPAPAPHDEPRTDPDVALAAEVLGAEQAMIDLISATVVAHPRLGPALQAATAVHTAHVDLLAEAAPPDTDASPSQAASDQASDPPFADPSEAAAGPDDRGVPKDAARALLRLAHAEEDLSQADKTSAFSAESGSFARVLASMAAAAAQQSAVLRTTRVPGSRR